MTALVPFVARIWLTADGSIVGWDMVDADGPIVGWDVVNGFGPIDGWDVVDGCLISI